MTVDYSRNMFFEGDKGANKPLDKPASARLNEITNYDDVGYYFLNEDGSEQTVLNYFHYLLPSPSDKPVVISPHKDNHFLFIITNYDTKYSKKQMKELEMELDKWIGGKISDLLPNVPSVNTKITISINPNKNDIILPLNSNTRGIFVFDYSSADVDELDSYDELKLAESLELKELIDQLKTKECKSIILGLFSQQIQNSLNDKYAIDKMMNLVTSESKEIGLLLLPLARKPIKHKMNFEIIACIEFVTKLLTDDHGVSKNLISAQDIIASRMQAERPEMEDSGLIMQACAIFLGCKQSKIEGEPSQNEQDTANVREFRKTGLKELDDVIEQVRSNGTFDSDGCGRIQKMLYNYIYKAVHMCNSIVRSYPEYKELFFSLILSMKTKSFTAGAGRGELNKDWILENWISYKNETNSDLTAILGKENLCYEMGGTAAETHVVNGFYKAVESLNKERKCKGSQLILREITDDFDKAKTKYRELVNRLRNGDLRVKGNQQGQVILALLLLDAKIADKIHALLSQNHSILHGPGVVGVPASFAYDYQSLYVDPEDERTLSGPKFRTTLNNLGDCIGSIIGDKLPEGKLGTIPETTKNSLTWWVK